MYLACMPNDVILSPFKNEELCQLSICLIRMGLNWYWKHTRYYQHGGGFGVCLCLLQGIKKNLLALENCPLLLNCAKDYLPKASSAVIKGPALSDGANTIPLPGQSQPLPLCAAA